ncbi:MAG: ATP phosphoribosyltransferase [Acidimicrobiia bacterium]
MPPQQHIMRLGLPKGRMQPAVVRLLEDAGIRLRGTERNYRPQVSLPGFEAKLLKPQNVVEMLHFGSRELGFAGADWVAELQADVVEILDTGLDAVRLVAAAPAEILEDGALPARPLVVASEYRRLAQSWLNRRRLDATLVHSYGATEVFPPEDADCIVDNTATGATLRDNGLVVIDELMQSSTRLYAHPPVLQDSATRRLVDHIVLLLESVLEARKRVLLDLNVAEHDLEAVLEALPAMKTPTVASLNSSGYAVRAAIPRAALPEVIAEVRNRGGTDLLVSSPSQIVP